MLRINRWLSARLGEKDSGVALAMVLGIGAVLLVLVAGMLTLATSSAVKANTDESWNAASAAAYAGVADYQSRLVKDNTYYKFGNPDAPFSASSRTSLSLPTGAAANPAFGLETSGSWATVSGSDGKATYRVEVDNSAFASTGVLRVRSTGRVGTVTRSVVANVRQKGFIDFLYFTDYETQDPAITGKLQSKCEKYFGPRPEAATGGRLDGDCGGAIQFVSGEQIDGPVHSNDAMYICGGVFKGKVTSNYPASPYFRNCGSATFDKGAPTFSDKMGMPPTNSQLRNETRFDLKASDVPRPGCLYTGPTTITYNGNGTMTVRSPWTRKVNIRENPTDGADNELCGAPGASGLGSATGATIPLLVQNVVFVQAVRRTVGDPNYWASGTTPFGFACSTDGNGLGYPIATSVVTGTGSSKRTVTTTETAVKSPMGTNYYDCYEGDVFVKGTMDGQMTIGAENYVWIIGDLVYKDRGAHILGLVGQNAVWVWNPYGKVACAGSCSGATTYTNKVMLTDTSRSVDAAILSVKHTFQVQNFDKGASRGDLKVWGAIAQKFRGTVGTGTGTTGYSKKYQYDLRLKNIAPPKFLSPVSTTYGVTTYAEVAAAFKANGTTIP